MVKDTQTIRLLVPTNCFSVFDHIVPWFDHFVGLALKGLTVTLFAELCCNNLMSRRVNLFAFLVHFVSC